MQGVPPCEYVFDNQNICPKEASQTDHFVRSQWLLVVFLAASNQPNKKGGWKCLSTPHETEAG